MSESYGFAVNVFRTVCDRLAVKATDLRAMVDTTSSFEEWLNWEAFLACKLRQDSYPFCEVAAKPAYATEGVVDDSGDPDRNFGDLRVGGSYEEGDHRWVFAEFALLHDGNRVGGKWLRKIESDADKLVRLGWRRPISTAYRRKGLYSNRNIVTHPDKVLWPKTLKHLAKQFPNYDD